MTGRAVAAESARVHVGMAARACAGSFRFGRKAQRGVARSARRRCVLFSQRERSLVVIETSILAQDLPSFRIVTVATIHPGRQRAMRIRLGLRQTGPGTDEQKGKH
ncbi:MAG TPA: hypothetical protein VGD49_01455 [Longimicrobiales bacterium]